MRRFRAWLWVASALLVAGCAPELPRRTRGLEPIRDSGRGIEVPDGGTPGLFDQAGLPPSSPSPGLPPGPGCGNDVVDPGEVCDGDLKSCSAIDAQTYSGGVATCNAGCSGYDLSACVKQAPKLSIDDAVGSITVSQLKQDLGTLASDGYNGRYPGSAGDQQTRSYIIAAFKAAGVGPGPGGSYQQSFSWNGIQTANVVGVLAGNHASLKDELVIVGAHHDHLGTTANYGCSSAGGSSVCNGADDNASGTVAVLAIARALAQLKGQNQRTLVFLLFGAEEKGLVGSSHYVNKAPLYPLSKTQYMINLDMLGYSTGTVQALGATRSQLAASWIGAAAAKHGITASTTFSAGGGSDHYHFALAGVPYVFFHTPGSPCYHATCDTADKIHHTEYAAITRLAARLMWTVSQASTGPRSDFQQPTAAATAPPPPDWKLFQDTMDHN